MTHSQKPFAYRTTLFPQPNALCPEEPLLVIVAGFLQVPEKSIDTAQALVGFYERLRTLVPGLSGVCFPGGLPGFLIAGDGRTRVTQVGDKRRSLQVTDAHVSPGKLQQETGIISGALPQLVQIGECALKQLCLGLNRGR